MQDGWIMVIILCILCFVLFDELYCVVDAMYFNTILDWALHSLDCMLFSTDIPLTLLFSSSGIT